MRSVNKKYFDDEGIERNIEIQFDYSVSEEITVLYRQRQENRELEITSHEIKIPGELVSEFVLEYLKSRKLKVLSFFAEGYGGD